MKILSLGLMAFVLVSSTSCMMMHNMCMPMNDDMETMNSSQVSKGLSDPVCGMPVKASTALTSNYEGVTYYFESEECLKVFQKNQKMFLKKDKEKSKKRMNSTIIMGGAAMVAMMAVMITIIFLVGGINL